MIPISQVPPRIKSNPINPLPWRRSHIGLDSNSQTLKSKKKYSNKLSMKALVEKVMLKKNKKKRGTTLNTPFFFINFSLTLIRKGAERGQRGKELI